MWFFILEVSFKWESCKLFVWQLAQFFLIIVLLICETVTPVFIWNNFICFSSPYLQAAVIVWYESFQCETKLYFLVSLSFAKVMIIFSMSVVSVDLFKEASNQPELYGVRRSGRPRNNTQSSSFLGVSCLLLLFVFKSDCCIMMTDNQWLYGIVSRLMNHWVKMVKI